MASQPRNYRAGAHKDEPAADADRDRRGASSATRSAGAVGCHQPNGQGATARAARNIRVPCRVGVSSPQLRARAAPFTASRRSVHALRSALCWRAPKFPLPGATAVGGGSTSCCNKHNPNSIRGRAHDRPDERRRVLLLLLPLQICPCSVKAVAPSGNGKAPNAIANVNASERETKPHIEATVTDGAETWTGSPARGSPATKVRAPKKKKKTSPIWNHFTELLVQEKANGIVIMKKMAECNYIDSIMDCDDGDNTMDLEEEDG